MHALLLALALSAAAPPAPAARFAVYADTRGNDAEHARIVAALAAAKPAFALFLGDATLSGNSAEEWARFDALERPLRAVAPIYPVRGNHDVGERFAEHLEMPPPGTRAGPGGLCYAFDALGLHLLALDSELPLGPDSAQLRFAAADLAAHAGVPTVVFLHRALLSSGAQGGDPDLRAVLQPLFEKAHVLAVFQAHDHDCERSLPQNGVTYFVEGGGGAPHAPMAQPAPAWSAFRYNGYGYLLVEVSAGALEVKAFDSASNLIDRVRLSWGPAAPQPAASTAVRAGPN
jgi:hypothetical protein